jgi:hypothetical protein
MLLHISKTHTATVHAVEKAVSLPALITLLVFSSLVISHTASAQSGSASGASTYRLIGTIQSEALSGAVVNDAAGQQSFYRLNETLPDGSQVVKILENSIQLRGADGVRYELFILHELKTAVPASPAPAISQPSPAAIMPDKAAGQRPSRVHRRPRHGSQTEEE